MPEILRINTMGNIYMEAKKVVSTDSTTKIDKEEAEKMVASMKDFLFGYFQELGPDPMRNIDVIVETAGKVLNPSVLLYNRMNDDGKLETLAIYNEPSDYMRCDEPNGHICYEMTIRKKSPSNLSPVVLNDIEGTPWEWMDSNVAKYNIKSYLAIPVALKDKTIGSLCVVNLYKKEFKQIEIDILESFAKAITLEEERHSTIVQLATANKKLKNKNAMIEHLAMTDPLTLLPNRRDIINKINAERSLICNENTGQKRKKTNSFVLSIGDIDFFKRINDKFGHDCGDYLLVEISKFFKSVIRKNDCVARWGGEEFLLLLKASNAQDGFNVVEKIRKKIESQKFTYKGIDHKITATFGLAEYDNPEIEIQEVIKKADQALYKGKKQGRNKTVLGSVQE